MQGEGLGLVLEQLGRKVMHGGHAAGGIGNLAGCGLHVAHQFAQIAFAATRVDGNRHRCRGGQAERCEVAVQIERQLRVECHVEGIGGRGQQQGVAIGRGPEHRLHADIAACADTVLDDDLLLPQIGQLVSHAARGEVGCTTGGEGHHQAHWLVRPVECVASGGCRYRSLCRALRLRLVQGAQQQCDCAQQQGQDMAKTQGLRCFHCCSKNINKINNLH